MKTLDKKKQLEEAVELVKKQALHLKESNAKTWGTFRQRVLDECDFNHRQEINTFWNLY